MRSEFVEGTAKRAEDMCPWACVIIPVDGGFHCFESRTDMEIWANQDAQDAIEDID